MWGHMMGNGKRLHPCIPRRAFRPGSCHPHVCWVSNGRRGCRSVVPQVCFAFIWIAGEGCQRWRSGGRGVGGKQPQSTCILCSLAFWLHSSAGVIAKGRNGSILLQPQEVSPHGQHAAMRCSLPLQQFVGSTKRVDFSGPRQMPFGNACFTLVSTLFMQQQFSEGMKLCVNWLRALHPSLGVSPASCKKSIAAFS